jgi:hypothetical protein
MSVDGVDINNPRGVLAPTSPAEVTPPTSTARERVSTLESATGGEVALLSAAPRGGEAFLASSAKDSPTAVGSGDLVREREVGAPKHLCYSITGLHSKYLIKTSTCT